METIFRAKKTKDADWISGHLLADHVKNKHFITGLPHPRHHIAAKMEVSSKTIGACTYLEDTSGKRIFESDILRCYPTGAPPILVYVFYISGAYGLCRINDPGKPVDLLTVIGKKMDILGNLHDNPELLISNRRINLL